MTSERGAVHHAYTASRTDRPLTTGELSRDLLQLKTRLLGSAASGYSENFDTFSQVSGREDITVVSKSF